MRAFTSDYFKHLTLPLYERLLKEADAEERTAKNFEGCSWMGDEHPASSHRRKAAELREAAFRIKWAEDAPKRRREAAEAKRKTAHEKLMNDMSQDRDW